MNLKLFKLSVFLLGTAMLFMVILIPQNAIMQEQENSDLDASIIGASKLSPGSTHIIYLSVQNNAVVESIDPSLGQLDLADYFGAAVGVTASLRSDDPLFTIDTKRMLLGTIPSGAVVSQLPFSLQVSKKANIGPARLFLDLTYKVLGEVEIGQTIDLLWTERTETIELLLEIVEKPLKFRVTEINPVLRPGMDDRLYLTIVNEGSEAANSATAKISASSPFTLTDDTAFLDTLEPGSSAVGVFGLKIAGDAIAKEYVIEAQVKYFDETNEEIHSDKFQVPVEVTPRSSFYSDIFRSQLAGGLVGAALASLIFLVWLKTFAKNKQETDR